MEGENQGTPIENSWEQTMEGYGLWEWEGMMEEKRVRVFKNIYKGHMDKTKGG